MGHTVKARCLDCGKRFTIDHGGGFIFHLVRCDGCGKQKGIPFTDLGVLHLRFIKGLGGPYGIATGERDATVREHAPVEPISEEEYHSGVERFAGKCGCGGEYKLDATPRCLKCGSTRIEGGETAVYYD